MAVVVFDADVLIAFLNASDAHNAEAIRRVQRALRSGERRVLSTITYAEILVGPSRTGVLAVQRIDAMLGRFGIEVLAADRTMSKAAAHIRARTGLKLPDAFVLAIAQREGADGSQVRVESFDERLLKAAAPG